MSIPDPALVPAPVCEVVRRLADAGHVTVLVGGCVRDLLRGEPVRDFDAATQAAPERVLALFPRAIPIGLHHGTVMVPTASGPVDVTTFRAGPDLADDLAHRDFTVNAIAFDPLGGEIVDPFAGRGDLTGGRLRAVGSAADRMGEDPLRALRAARLVSTLGLEPDADVVDAMAGSAKPLEAVARERVRAELTGLFLGERAGAALALLRRTGLEAGLAPRAADDAPRIVDALPRDLDLRLAAWLRGGRALSTLGRLRFPRRTVLRVDRLLRQHPIEAGANPDRDPSVRRLLRRAGADLEDLFRLRRAELAAGSADGAARKRLDRVEEAVVRVQQAGQLALRRLDLAIDGRGVMARLGCGPGPQVGEALAHLTERVIDDPSCNTPDRLGELLDGWWSARTDSA